MLAPGGRTVDLATRRKTYAAQLDEAVRTVVDTLRRVDGIERISVFGSYARGRRDLTTDVDILVVWDTGAPFLDRLKSLYGLVHVPVDLDIVCYTPAEFQELRDQAFLREATATEIVLYAKKPA